MVGIGKLAATPGAGRYYVEQVASGREDYYTGEGEAPGYWAGAAAAGLGLSGRVGGDELYRLLEARNPADGQPLREGLKSGCVAGFDISFRAPKSASILFGVADPAVAAEVREAHDAAVARALRYLEQEACVVRRGAGGAIQLPATGFVAAAFRHRSSRAGDPLLHTHVVIGNLGLGPDGRWTALFGRLVYKHAKTAGSVYQAELRHGLTERLGVTWTEPKNGLADIEGISRPVIDHFSQRREEILSSLAERGERSARAAQIAALDTRKSKGQLTLGADQRGEWRRRAAENGLDLHTLDQLLDRPAMLDAAFDLDELLGPSGLTKQSSSFERLDVIQAVANAARAGATGDELERRADEVLADSRVVELGEGRFSTRELLDLELEVLETADARREAPPAVDCSSGVHEAAARRPTLAGEQRALVEQVVTGDGGVQVVLAPAGTGKTFALDAAREAWQRHDVPVLGCALSARAACELREQAGINATTIARLRLALDGGARLTPGSVLIVDEAGMVGTRDLAALAAAANDANARLVLVGDDRQLPEINAGGTFRALARQQDAVPLTDVRRQGEAWDREALAQLRDGDLDAFGRAYQQHGRVITAPTADLVRTKLVDDWAAARDSGADALMLAYRRSDVADLNRRARVRLRAAGQLGPDLLATEERAFAVGDDVVATRNDSRLAVHNGLRGRITRMDGDEVEMALTDTRTVTLPAAYVTDGHLDHAYALTAHRAQGATVDRTFVLGSDELSREWGYTALSRHREDARFYLSASPAFLNTPAPALTAGDDAAPAVANALRSRRVELTAAEQRTAAYQQLHAAEDRVDELQAELDATSPLRRGRRAELRQELADATRRRDFEAFKTERHEQAAARPPIHRGDLERARDPLGLLRGPDLPALTRTREQPQQDLELEL